MSGQKQPRETVADQNEFQYAPDESQQDQNLLWSPGQIEQIDEFLAEHGQNMNNNYHYQDFQEDTQMGGEYTAPAQYVSGRYHHAALPPIQEEFDACYWCDRVDGGHEDDCPGGQPAFQHFGIAPPATPYLRLPRRTPMPTTPRQPARAIASSPAGDGSPAFGHAGASQFGNNAQHHGSPVAAAMAPPPRYAGRTNAVQACGSQLDDTGAGASSIQNYAYPGGYADQFRHVHGLPDIQHPPVLMECQQLQRYDLHQPPQRGHLPFDGVPDAQPPAQDVQGQMLPTVPQYAHLQHRASVGDQAVGQDFQAQNRLNPKHLRQPAQAAPQQQQQKRDRLQGTPAYQFRHADIATARAHLNPPAKTDLMVDISPPEGDDDQAVETNLHNWASALFTAISHPPGPPPIGFPAEFIPYYTSHQSNEHNAILAHTTTNPIASEARTLLFLSEILSIHQLGIPTSVAQRKAHRQGYIFEHHGTCSQRIETVINCLRQDKYVALDVLSGHGIVDFARSPSRYLRRKQENSRVNARKAHDKKVAEEKGTLKPPSRGGRKPQEALTGFAMGSPVEDPAAAPANTAPFAGFSTIQQQQAPIQQVSVQQRIEGKKRAREGPKDVQENGGKVKRTKRNNYDFGFANE
ncbi:Hypothetical predicted protein [Lecanosticta acicola]|uniref:Uncharacterized protein n=1 Tax=Lecanosticta acicola TaxID=111012 RepID=A0AAI8Z111_9PEZI|nr:Hypothetical predicted protein [Lecanosticta acicola]